MTADTSRSAITLPAADDSKRQNSVSNTSDTKIKSELSWSQLINAEIIGKQKNHTTATAVHSQLTLYFNDSRYKCYA